MHIAYFLRIYCLYKHSLLLNKIFKDVPRIWAPYEKNLKSQRRICKERKHNLMKKPPQKDLKICKQQKHWKEKQFEMVVINVENQFSNKKINSKNCWRKKAKFQCKAMHLKAWKYNWKSIRNYKKQDLNREASHILQK